MYKMNNKKVGISIVLLLILMFLTGTPVREALAKVSEETIKNLAAKLGKTEIKFEIKVIVRTDPGDEPVEDANITANVVVPRGVGGFEVITTERVRGKKVSLTTKKGTTDRNGEWEDEGETTMLAKRGMSGNPKPMARRLMNKGLWQIKLTLENCPPGCVPRIPTKKITAKSVELTNVGGGWSNNELLVKYEVELICDCNGKPTKTGYLYSPGAEDSSDPTTSTVSTGANYAVAYTESLVGFDRSTLSEVGRINVDPGEHCKHCFTTGPVILVGGAPTFGSEGISSWATSPPPGQTPDPIPDIVRISKIDPSDATQDTFLIMSPTSQPASSDQTTHDDLTTSPIMTGIYTTGKGGEGEQTSTGQASTGTPEDKDKQQPAATDIVGKKVTRTVELQIINGITGAPILNSNCSISGNPRDLPTVSTDGGEKIDDGYNEDPVKGTGPTTFTVSGQGVGSAAEGPAIKVVIEYIPFESYIVKIDMDKGKENWDDPASYFDPIISSMVVRKWIVDDSMYVVVNVPIVEE